MTTTDVTAERRRELLVLLDRMEQLVGSDYRGYRLDVLAGRLGRHLRSLGLASVADLVGRLQAEGSPSDELANLAVALSATPGPLFADPALWQALRARVVPFLRTYPRINVWVPNCGPGGEAAYSMAILLREAGLHERARIYATDVSDSVIERARVGMLLRDQMPTSTVGYVEGGGLASLREYYASEDGAPHVRPVLRERIVFAQHNLATDASFIECHLILARATLGDLAPDVQPRALDVVRESVCRFGILEVDPIVRLPVGAFEGLEPVGGQAMLFRKVR